MNECTVVLRRPDGTAYASYLVTTGDWSEVIRAARLELLRADGCKKGTSMHDYEVVAVFYGHPKVVYVN